MLVNKTLETADGTVHFEGELSEQELDLVLKIGLNYLLGMGALPFKTKTVGEEVGIDMTIGEQSH